MNMDIGAKAPDFTLLSSENEEISLRDFKNKNVLLFFYPKDFTPYCTREVCNFRDFYANLHTLQTEIIGISCDSTLSHKKFITKYKIPFILLSDPDCSVAERYGAINSGLLGKTILKRKRMSFLINKEGTLIKIWTQINVDAHAQEIIDFIKNHSL